MNTYRKIFDKYRFKPHIAAQKSRAWFHDQVSLLRAENVTATQLITDDKKRNRTANMMIPGEMYLFGYEAKHKDTLPYWDMFPLIFPFKKLEDGFMGLNMHYLPYPMRIELLDRLMEFRSNSRLDATTRLKFSWQVIKGVSHLKAAEPCVHRYLYTHVRTQLKTISANDWVTALLLPVEKFVGESKQKVWSISARR